MGTLALAYGVASTLIAAYAVWLGLQNRQLARRLDALEMREQVETRESRAA